MAIATLIEPDILIVDEVLSVGDLAFQEKCLLRIDEMLNNGTTLLYVSHSIEQVKKLCKKAIWIKNGKEEMKGDVEIVSDVYLKYMMHKNEHHRD